MDEQITPLAETVIQSVPSEIPPPLQSKPSLTWIIVAVMAGLLMLLVGLQVGALYFFNKPQITAPAPTPQVQTSLQAKATYLTGSAWRIVAGRKIELREDDTLSELDEVMTESNTRLIVQFDDGSVITLGDNTRVRLAQLKPSSMVISEEKGSLFARVHKDPLHVFIIAAGMVDVQAHGTTFAVERDETVKVKVFESTVNVVNNDTETEVAANQQWQSKDKDVTRLEATEVSKDEFLKWNLETQNPSPTPTATPEPTASLVPTVQPTAISGIKLIGEASATDIILNWTTSRITEGGIKLIKSLEPKPKYPGSDYIFLDTLEQHNYVWHITDGKAWHFRACHFVDGSCRTYSNDIEVKAPATGETTGSTEIRRVSSISLTASKDGTTAKLNWEVNGLSEKGFKIVWSDQEHPVYPSRESDHYHYFTEVEKRSDTVTDLSGKTYYFRVCEYLGGSCGVYSNEVSLSF